MSGPPDRWAGPPPWVRRRRHRGGFGCLFLVLFVLVGWPLVFAVTAALSFLVRNGGYHVGLVLVVLAVVVIVATGRMFTGTGQTLDDLADASRRVASGDLTARVPEPSAVPRRLRELVASFRTMVDRLGEDERQRRRLLADVSHELRTPLAVVQGSVEAMLDGVHPADEAHLRAVLAETEVLSRLVDDLRTVTLSESGTLALHPEPTDLVVITGELEASFRARLDTAGASLSIEASDDLPLLFVDPVRTREVLANLVGNALDHAGSGVRIAITARAVPGTASVEISVSDDGPGIAPELLPTLFDRFVKSPASRGSGLGLAIARNLVLAQGGAIEVASRVGEGTAFTIRLPAATPEL